VYRQRKLFKVEKFDSHASDAAFASARFGSESSPAFTVEGTIAPAKNARAVSRHPAVVRVVFRNRAFWGRLASTMISTFRTRRVFPPHLRAIGKCANWPGCCPLLDTLNTRAIRKGVFPRDRANEVQVFPAVVQQLFVAVRSRTAVCEASKGGNLPRHGHNAVGAVVAHHIRAAYLTERADIVAIPPVVAVASVVGCAVMEAATRQCGQRNLIRENLANAEPQMGGRDDHQYGTGGLAESRLRSSCRVRERIEITIQVR